MSFVDIVAILNLIVLIVIAVIFSYVGCRLFVLEKFKTNSIYTSNLLILSILQRIEKRLKEKGIKDFSADDIYDVYMRLGVFGATQKEIDDAIDKIFNQYN